ncbi:MAG: protein kinase [Thermogemmatispora sp.]|jgi:cytochrome c-type biogenesis protein CcmH/NrfG|uniref:serine/threonine-protein kinase n=1 Tax=Thermogemmatispora sp. TaxID=1968838 RepID=UPI0019F57F95|nr:serine/threonine-protein kinase [Thermogemmatispora sp.]MBE3564348.1 protein kinase [Thermogemmatispora sp.]
MASNHSDPREVVSAGNAATPSSWQGESGPRLPPPPEAPAAVGAGSVTPASVGSQAAGAGVIRLSPGVLLSNGRYKIEHLVAAGGMGAVYRAIDLRFERPCAVKEMLDDFQSEVERNQAVEWFKREATLLLDLNHPCIPRVRDFFVEEGRHYLVMDFIEGRTLAKVLEEEGNVVGVNGARGVPEARARSWAQQICNVLSYLHRQNPPIIFRDLKPSNVMVTDRDEIKLIDFGIARTFQSQRQATIIMTIGYAPPEQLHGMPEPRSDIYALGATLHRLLTHHDAANNRPTIFSFPPLRSLRPDVSPEFEQVIMKALSPNVEQRWSSAAEMERAILSLPPIKVVPPLTSSVPPTVAASPATPRQVALPVGGTTGPAGQFILTAQAQLQAGRIEAAYAAVQQAYALEPNNALVHKIFGQVFARRQPPDPQRAIQAYNRSVQLNPNDAETHKLVGDVYHFILMRPGDAITAYTQSLRLNPNDFEAHQRLAQCYERLNQLEPALREFQEALRLTPKVPTLLAALHYEIGQLAWRLNQLSLAERSFVQVLIINPADHQTRFLLSQVYERENKLGDALRECRYVVGAMPTNQAAQAMLQRLQARLGR